MTGFIDLERRFHELTDQEVDDLEDLAAWSEYRTWFDHWLVGTVEA